MPVITEQRPEQVAAQASHDRGSGQAETGPLALTSLERPPRPSDRLLPVPAAGDRPVAPPPGRASGSACDGVSTWLDVLFV